ncbi:pyrroloquinoline quinone biosynthesis protein PqqB [Bacillus sp. REN16]|uniref:pyrroloquinoline quinone biosynthesis protein PqqB n=1 Tax=Bacillus sp. REN16 TaxID=2887296 RepID=UPI002B4BFC09|nr:pyrroloquinoline quinone biosynthesis protein PqqB [Bacillus sp. REN16]MCC3359236.1 pyrroloquinoline quinone biosynthesis protein PqqB [Bacillus sp. REN16]
MRIRVLGVAAGGGFPQWNCACPNCRDVRGGDTALKPMLQSSLAISPNEKDWYLVNAGPDVSRQIETFSALHAGPGIRETPLAGVILTDAELDHSIGLLSLREGSHLTIYGTETVRKCLDTSFPVIPMLKNYCSWEWQTLAPDVKERIGDSILIETVPVSRKPPLYAKSDNEESEGVWEVGLLFQNERSGKCVAYFPTLDTVTSEIESALHKADILLVDGTFWSEDELVSLGATKRNARDMGHLPISGPSGIIEKLASFSAERKILIHINNSNPILKKGSKESELLKHHGIEIAYEGMEVEV